MCNSLIGSRAAVLEEKFRDTIGLPFRDVLSEEDIEAAVEAEGATYRERVFSPLRYDLGDAVSSPRCRSRLSQSGGPNFG